MTFFRTTVCITALCAGTGAMADVTALEVWEDWKDNFEDASKTDLTISGEDIGDGVVTITDMVLTNQNDGETISAAIGTVAFTEQGDGTVAVQMEDSYLIEIQSSDADSTLVQVSQSGLVMIASGSDKYTNYAVSADRYEIAIVEILEGGEPMLDGEMLIALNDLAGSFGSVTDEFQQVSYDFDIGAIDLLADFAEPNGPGNVLISGKIETAASTSRISLPLDFPDTDAPFMVGFGVLSDTNFGSANFIFDVDASGSKAVGSIALGAGNSSMLMHKDELSTGFEFTDVAVAMESSDMPLPINITFSDFVTGLKMPLSVTEDPQEFTVLAKLTELVVNDEIWDMGDPGKVLPRDPITFDLDLGGQAKLFFDILDPAQEAARDQADAPGELHAISINNLLVSAAGAMISGSGAFTFDNDDLTTFDGIPRPLGDATVEITGANALIDNLVMMGLLPLDQASMGRMMMGMFARSIGDDQLQSKVEVNSNGHLIVNGQRMQ